MRRAGVAIAMVVAGLGLAGCVRVEPLAVADRAGDIPLAQAFGDDADLVCVHDPAPPWQFDTISFTALGQSLKRSSVVQAHCPKVRGLWRRGRWVASYETVVLGLRNCEVVGVRSIAMGERRALDGAPDDFCTTPDRLIVGHAPEPRLMNAPESP